MYVRNVWEKWDIEEDLAGGRRGSDSPFQIICGKGTVQFFKALETNLRLAGRKYNESNFDG